MIEALATGTPVLGTPFGSAPEIVAHGVTCYLASIEDLAAMIPAAAGLSRAQCRAQVEQQFSAERMVADHLRLFAELIEEQSGGRVPESVPSSQSL
jgi:glycosyltransferase involved in cell wall biosynthesis